MNDNMTVANRFENGYGLGVRQPLQRCAVHGQDLISCVANKRRCMTMYGDENINMEISVFFNRCHVVILYTEYVRSEKRSRENKTKQLKHEN